MPELPVTYSPDAQWSQVGESCKERLSISYSEIALYIIPDGTIPQFFRKAEDAYLIKIAGDEVIELQMDYADDDTDGTELQLVSRPVNLKPAQDFRAARKKQRQRATENTAPENGRS